MLWASTFYCVILKKQYAMYHIYVLMVWYALQAATLNKGRCLQVAGMKRERQHGI